MSDILPANQEAPNGGWEMKSLKPKHKQICSMLAQGIDRGMIAQVVGVTPEYVTMLASQPLMKEYMRDLCALADIQLEGMFIKSVKAIGDVLDNGSGGDRMKAARLQMEATKRIGSGAVAASEAVNVNERLVQLAEKLVDLQSRARPARVIDVPTIEVQNG